MLNAQADSAAAASAEAAAAAASAAALAATALPEATSSAPTASDPTPSKLKGSRVIGLSPQHKLAVREFATLTGVSDKRCSRAQLLIVHSTMTEMSRQGLFQGEVPSLEAIAKVVPSNMKMVHDSCRAYDEELLAQRAQRRLDKGFVITDAGAAGKKKETYVIFSGFDHIDGCVVEEVAGGEPISGGGKKTAELVKEKAAQISLDLAGSATDNASDVIKTFVAEMQSSFDFFVAVGCTLHILNLVLMNAYHSTFGFEEMGVCSALRCGYIINYLMSLEGNLDAWKKWARDNGHEAIAYKACGASKSRWWSVVQSFGDVYRNREAYSDWCIFMANGAKSTSSYKAIFEEAATWLQNQKVTADLAFVLGFNIAFWDPEMKFCQGIGPWQKDLPAVKQKAGYRADEYSVHAVLARRKLIGLNPFEDDRFSDFQRERALLSAEIGEGGEESERDFMDKQVGAPYL